MYENPKYKGNVIIDLTLEFALAAVRYCEQLETGKKYVVAHQFLRSATSIGACAREAQNAESRADFVHKMKIASKELDETEYWLAIYGRSADYPSPKNPAAHDGKHPKGPQQDYCKYQTLIR